jgi:hypothetical protein
MEAVNDDTTRRDEQERPSASEAAPGEDRGVEVVLCPDDRSLEEAGYGFGV